ncbi:hypothetical protein Q7P37_008041 [Cladosporium fusiforme]
MCDYTQVEYACGHLRFTVRAWCIKYQETHKRCPPNVVAIEYRLNEKRLPRLDITTPDSQEESKPGMQAANTQRPAQKERNQLIQMIQRKALSHEPHDRNETQQKPHQYPPKMPVLDRTRSYDDNSNQP